MALLYVMYLIPFEILTHEMGTVGELKQVITMTATLTHRSRSSHACWNRRKKRCLKQYIQLKQHFWRLCHKRCENILTNLHCFMLMMIISLVPDPPNGVQSLSITATSANISWEAPVALVSTPISDIERYELIVYEHQHNLPTIFANTTALNYVFTGLEEFVNYTCEVAAVNRVGQGQYSTAFTFLTHQAGM